MTDKNLRGRFKHPLHPLAARFNASLSFDHQLYPFDIAGSKAHVIMLGKQNLLTETEVHQICQGLDEILKELDAKEIVLDESYEDIHLLIEHHLIQKIGETGKKLHTGRSRNDQVALDLRLYARQALDHCMTLLKEFITTLTVLATHHQQDSMPGYTHLQQAQPVSLGTWFDAYANMFSRDLSRCEDCKKRLNYSPLGAGALAGSQLPLDRNMTASLLGFDGIIPNTLDAVSDRDFVVEFCAVASLMMVHLSRISEDLIIWSTQEFHFIELDDAFATGSSLMPNKKNPDIPELARGKAGRVFGHLMGMLTVMKGLPMAYNKDMQEDKEALFDTVNTLTACLEIFPAFLKSIHFNLPRLKAYAEQDFLQATALVEKLVQQGMPFRDAHKQVGEWILEVLEKNSSLATISAFVF